MYLAAAAWRINRHRNRNGFGHIAAQHTLQPARKGIKQLTHYARSSRYHLYQVVRTGAAHGFRAANISCSRGFGPDFAIQPPTAYTYNMIAALCSTLDRLLTLLMHATIRSDGAASTRLFTVRPATRADVPAMASLLLEGFGHEYGGMLRRRAGRRFIERVHALPGRLAGMVVAVDRSDTPIGVAGLRTAELRPRSDGAEEQAMFEELGVGSSILIDLYASLMEPLPYQPRRDEGIIYSVTVTAPWRGHGVGAALLDFLHDRARSLGKRVAVLEVVASNRAARRLYERHDYHVAARRRSLLGWLPFGVPPVLLMRKSL